MHTKVIRSHRKISILALLISLSGSVSAQAPKVKTRPDGTQQYDYNNGASCIKRADFANERTISGKLSITSIFSGEGSSANKIVNAASHNPSTDAIDAALFDICSSYGSGLIKKDDYDSQRKALSDLRILAIQHLISDSTNPAKPAASSGKTATSTDSASKVASSNVAATTPSTLPAPKAVTPSSNSHYDDLFVQNQGNELKLAELGEDAFARLDYPWSLKFLEQAKTVESSKVWQKDYPLLAASYLLADGNRDQFKATLQDMLASMRTPNTFLHHPQGMGMALQSLSNARIYVDKDAQAYIDTVVAPETVKIRQTL